MRKHLGDDPVSIAFIAACTGHHIPLWYSSALIVMRAKLKRLVTEKARFKMPRFGITIALCAITIAARSPFRTLQSGTRSTDYPSANILRTPQRPEPRQAIDGLLTVTTSRAKHKLI